MDDSEQHKPPPKDTTDSSKASPAISESSSAHFPFKARKNAYFSASCDGRVRLTFPSSSTRSTHGQSYPQPARYDQTSTPESSDGHNSAAKTSLRLMTDQSLSSALEPITSTPPSHPASGGEDLAAWIESSRQTILHNSEEMDRRQSEEGQS